MEWDNDKRTQSSQDDSMKSISEKRANSVNGGNKEKTNDNSTTPSKKRGKKASADGDASHPRPIGRTNEERASDVDSSKSKTKHVEASSHETPPDLDSPTSGQSLDPVIKDDNDKLSASRKSGRQKRLRGLVSEEALEETVVETSSKSDVAKPPFGPIVVGLTHDGKMIKSRGDTRTLEHLKAAEGDEKNVDDHENIGSEQKKEGEVTIPQRKRGRPPKESFRVGSPRTNEKECLPQRKKNDGSDAKDDESESPISEVEKPIAVEPSGTSDPLPNISMESPEKQSRKRKVSTRSVMHDFSEPLETVVKKGKKHKSRKQVESQTEDAVDNSRVRAIEVFSNGIDKVVAGTSSNASDDDRPLSTWIDGAVFPLATDSRIPPGGTAGQSDGSAQREEIAAALVVGHVQGNGYERPEDMVIPSNSNAILPVEARDSPFVKHSVVWQLIDNMDVLRRIPQEPHFRPLYNCKVECREGLAIGSMITFSSLVDQISKSRFSDSRSLLDGYLEALVDLEELGFNVTPVRERLLKLIFLKNKYEYAQNTVKEIESQIKEHNLEKSAINSEMSEIDRKIGELMEKRASIGSKKERKEAEITMLETSIEALKGGLENAEEEYEKVTSELW